MIKVNDFVLNSTRFPDGTSQVWKLPEEILKEDLLTVEWRFEEERELFDLFSLRKLCPATYLHLYIPFLPYARQDKPLANDSTFNLYVFADLLNQLHANQIEAIDTHNPALCKRLISGFSNIRLDHIIQRMMDDMKPDVLVYPDKGASERYRLKHESIMVFEKTRDQSTGTITGHHLASHQRTPERVGYELQGKFRPKKFLIVDDICDGGATFISVAASIRKRCPSAIVDLYVSHGIFSKGRQALHLCGIDEIYTTDSLPRNNNLKGVTKV